MSENLSNEYSKEYSEESFWRKVKKYSLKAGKEVIEKALMLFYCLQEKDTPKWAKAVIVAALGYFIFPLDAIPDILFPVGYTDDAAVVAAVLVAVRLVIKEEQWKKADEFLAGL